MKTCTKCGKHKDLSKFAKNKKSSDGYAWRCKSCVNTAYRKKKLTGRPYDIPGWNPITNDVLR